MVIKRSILVLLFTIGCVFVAYAQYPGTNIRGQMVTHNQFGQQVPLISAKVDLYLFNPQTQQWIFMSATYTDGYGFFFFRYVPVNNYVISVNGLKSFNIQVVPIDYRYYNHQELGYFIF
jgi:hypothetical protein